MHDDRIPLVMLVTELSVTNDGAEFFGFWYWKRMEPPEPGEARCGFFWDLMVGEQPRGVEHG